MRKIYSLLFIFLKRIKMSEFESKFLRFLFKKLNDSDVGLHSYGCFDLSRIPKGTIVGRYCSFSRTCILLNANHPLGEVSLHPYFYNSSLGMVNKDRVPRTKFIIEDDVWIGYNAIILPSAKHIGRGAVIAAGAVVTKNVPPYSIVAGVPAKIIGYRFDEEKINEIEASKWWEEDKLKNYNTFVGE